MKKYLITHNSKEGIFEVVDEEAGIYYPFMDAVLPDLDVVVNNLSMCLSIPLKRLDGNHPNWRDDVIDEVEVPDEHTD